MGDNGKEKKQFEIQITCSPDTRQVGIRSNVKDMLLGLGMLEMARDLFKVQIASLNQPKIQKPGGIMNFVRGGMKNG